MSAQQAAKKIAGGKKGNHRRQIEIFQDHVDMCTAEEMYTFFCRAVSIIAATMLSD